MGRIGAYELADAPVTLNQNRATRTLLVKNNGRRVIQVGSHYHFMEVNRDLFFDREAALGMHLDIPAGTSVRFMPGEEKAVRLVAYGGKQVIVGFHGLVNGCVTDESVRTAAIENAKREGLIGGGAK